MLKTSYINFINYSEREILFSLDGWGLGDVFFEGYLAFSY